MRKQTQWTRLVQKTYKEGKKKNASFSLGDAMKMASKSRKSMGGKNQKGGDPDDVVYEKAEDGDLTCKKEGDKIVEATNTDATDTFKCKKTATVKPVTDANATGGPATAETSATGATATDANATGGPATGATATGATATGATATGATGTGATGEPATGGRRKRTKRGGSYSKKRSYRSRSRRSSYW